MTIGTYIVASALAVIIYMMILFVIALVRKDNSVADVGWGPGFLLVWVVTAVLEPGLTSLQGLSGCLAAIWGLRLAIHVHLRNRGRGEDFRYARWRRDWGRRFVPRAFLQVFMLQGFFLLLIAAPIVIINRSPAEPRLAPALAGMIIWTAGFVLESIADAQKSRFKKDPANRGRIMTDGLWGFSRHPNYFGEAAMWWGIFSIGLSVPLGWAGVTSPLAITILLRWVSGVPLLESKYRGNPEYQDYARRTNAFVPWFPRKVGKSDQASA
jgi:steroid 5-alpha reductase family enzyme